VHVDLEAVSFAYRSRVLFTGLTDAFASGEMTGVVGPSGSGKSTLLGMIAGHLIPTAGRVRYPEELLDKDVLRPHLVGWMMQTANVFPRRTVLDNAALPAVVGGLAWEDATSRAQAALSSVGLADRAADPCVTLSGGERQRVVVARVLAASTMLLIADEPTASLDAANRDVLVACLRSVAASGAIVVVATHDLAVAQSCDRVLAL
jgi:ABC-type lipoprotein export system ATPase subunit